MAASKFMLAVQLAVSAEATWILGNDGSSCDSACAGVGLQCSSSSFHEHNAEANSEGEVSALLQKFSETCTSYNLNYGSNTDVPSFQKSTGTCYVSEVSRAENKFSCARPASAGKQRLCWCAEADSDSETSSAAASGCAQNESDDSVELSGGVIIWIISGTMLVIVLFGMLFAIARNCIRRRNGREEGKSIKNRPEDSGFYARCPKCGCPIEQSHALGGSHAVGTSSRPVGTTSHGTKSHGTRSHGMKTHGLGVRSLALHHADEKSNPNTPKSETMKLAAIESMDCCDTPQQSEQLDHVV